MDKKKFNKELFEFISSATCSFTCVDTIRKSLLENGYKELYENELWNIKLWMDVPLSVSGRVILKDGNKYKRKVVNLNKPLCVIPSEAIHQNKRANTNLDLNTQIDLIPIISLDKEKDIIKILLRKEMNLKDDIKICDYDLFLHSLDKPMYIREKKEMIYQPVQHYLVCV